MGIYVLVCACVKSVSSNSTESIYSRAPTFENFWQGEDGAVASALEAVHDCVALVPFLEMVPEN
jgi:hypothetical protein